MEREIFTDTQIELNGKLDSLHKIFPNVKFCFSVPGHQEHRAAVGRAADQRGLHRHGADHGLGEQGHRDQERRDRTPGRGVHAQEGAETQVPV